MTIESPVRGDDALEAAVLAPPSVGHRADADADIAAQRARRRRPRPSILRRTASLARCWLLLIILGQVALAFRPGVNGNAFEDEGLYIYIGHRVIERILHGTPLPGYPGAFFSGAPGLYPVLAALADNLGGLAGARALSTAFAVLATICVYGAGNRLFGRTAGLVGAACFVPCGSVVFISHFATYDAMMMALVAVATWLAVWSAQRNAFAWAPAVSSIMAVAFLTKYAAAAYLPVVVTIAAAAGWPLYRWRIIKRAAFSLIAAVIMAFAAIELWGQSLIPGIRQTTSNRVIIYHETFGTLGQQVLAWAGLWVAFAVAGAAFRFRRQAPLVLALLFGAVVGPLEQMRIGEQVSLNKHVAFGIIFAAPLIGDLFARLIAHIRLWVLPVAAAAIAAMTVCGVVYSHRFATDWPNDSQLRVALEQALHADPNARILGDRYSPQRYELQHITSPSQWFDTYYFRYGAMLDEPAFASAIDDHYFGIVYLDRADPTPFGNYLYDYLTKHSNYYQLAARVPREWHGRQVGYWYIFTPRIVDG